VPAWVDVLLGLLGLALLISFVAVSRRTPHPLTNPRLLVEPRFLRSAVAAFAQMFALISVLVAVPLYITGTLGRSSAVTGLLFFALPLAMAVLAPAVGMLSDRIGPRPIMRAGLVVLACACLAVGAFTAAGDRDLPLLCGLLVVVGAGVAMVQTPSATGATRSPAGRQGSALGLFNTMRFGGSAFGAAWVAVLYPRGELFALFVGAALLLVLSLVATFVGSNPPAAAVDAPLPGGASAL
jgi:MFS family permease